MSENGPVMYRVKPLYDSRPDISLPTCMYKMNNLINPDAPCDIRKIDYENAGQDDLNLIELEKHQLNIIQKLEDLKSKVIKMKEDLGIKEESHVIKSQDIVIKAHPENPPLSVWVFYQLISQTTSVRLVTHMHSSLKSVPESISQISASIPNDKCTVSLTIIWREGSKDPEMMIDPIHQGPIEGEVNIARYLSRLMSINYDADPILSTLIDNWLETAHSSIVHGNNKDRQGALRSLNSHLGKNSFLVGSCLTVADIVVWSSLVQAKLHLSLPANVDKWFKSLSNSEAFQKCGEFASL